MMMIIAPSALVLIRSVNLFALKEKMGLKGKGTPVPSKSE